jgi:flagellar biosynthesis protein FlhF
MRQQPETYHGASLPGLLAAIRHAHGEDAILVSMRGPSETDGTNYEVIAAPADWMPLRGHQRPAVTRVGASPHTVVLIGPPGSGKTTTAVKLALHDLAFGDRNVGLITLDTFRAGAIEQIQVFADIAGLPLEVAYDAADVRRARKALDHCDVLIVDTPGRGMHERNDLEWQACLAALEPDEIDLVLPAGLRPDVAKAIRRASERLRPTHAIVTMVDELPDRSGLEALSVAIGLPIRWTTDGPSVPADLSSAMHAAHNALGRTA